MDLFRPMDDHHYNTDLLDVSPDMDDGEDLFYEQHFGDQGQSHFSFEDSHFHDDPLMGADSDFSLHPFVDVSEGQDGIMYPHTLTPSPLSMSQAPSQQMQQPEMFHAAPPQPQSFLPTPTPNLFQVKQPVQPTIRFSAKQASSSKTPISFPSKKSPVSRPQIKPVIRPIAQQPAPQRNPSTPPMGNKGQAAPTYDQVERFEQLTDHQLATIDFKVLLDLAHKAGFNEEKIAEVKARRRRLKNRLSARICSNKKREKCTELEETNKTLTDQVSKLKQENMELQNLNVMYAKDLGECHTEIERLTKHIEQLTQMMVANGLLQQEVDVSMAA